MKKLIWFFWGIINIQVFGQQYMDSKKADALTNLYFTEGIKTLKDLMVLSRLVYDSLLQQIQLKLQQHENKKK